MAVSRTDFIEKTGVYSLGGKDGEWMVHSHQEQPFITMKNIDTGELFDMPMQSMHNVKSKMLRKLEKGEQTAEPRSKEVVTVIEKELTPEQVKANVSGIASLMLSDGASLIHSVLELKGKPGKKLCDQLESWVVQVKDFIGNPESFESEDESEQDEDANE